MGSLRLLVFLVFPQLVFADIANEDLGSTKINSTFEETRNALNKGGWRVGERMQNNTIDTFREVSGNYYKIKVVFSETHDGLRSKSIIYEQDYRTENVDANMMKSELLEKYGEPYAMDDISKALRMNFTDFNGDIPTQKKIMGQCQSEIVASGRQPLEALARGESNLAVSLGSWINYGYEKVQESCPNVMTDFEKLIEFLLAPQLEVMVAPGINGKVIRTIKWEGPSRRYEHDQKILKEKKLDGQPKAKLD